MDSVIFWNEVLLIGGAVIGFLGGMTCGYERGRQGLSFWGKRPPDPGFMAEQIIGTRLYSTAAARRVGVHGSRFLYLTEGGEFFSVVDHSGGTMIEVLSRHNAREWVLRNLPAREGRAALEEWFAERIELA